MRRFCSSAVLALLFLTLDVTISSAQECIGLPSGRGILTYGFEGTDGAMGEGLSFAYQARNASVLVQHRSLDGFTLVDELRTSQAQASLKLSAPRISTCLTAGAQWTAYDNDRLESESWSARNPGYKIEEHRIGGPYQRLRIPIGVGAGHEFRIAGRLLLIPFVSTAVVFEHESYDHPGQPAEVRRTVGLGGGGGISAALGWGMIRAHVSHTATHEYALSSQHNFPEFSLQFGVRF